MILDSSEILTNWQTSESTQFTHHKLPIASEVVRVGVGEAWRGEGVAVTEGDGIEAAYHTYLLIPLNTGFIV